MRNKNEYRSEIALYKKRKMMCQTQQLFAFKNRFTKIVTGVAFTACLHVNLSFASFKSLMICPRPQQEAAGLKDSVAGRDTSTKVPEEKVSIFFVLFQPHPSDCFVLSSVLFWLVCCSLWPRPGASTRWKPPERRRAWRCLVCCRWKQSVKMIPIKMSLARQ